MEIGLKLDGQEFFSTSIELLIKILATQKATATVLVELLSKSEDEANDLISSLNAEVDQYSKIILRSLYERRGKIDLNDILGDE